MSVAAEAAAALAPSDSVKTLISDRVGEPRVEAINSCLVSCAMNRPLSLCN